MAREKKMEKKEAIFPIEKGESEKINEERSECGGSLRADFTASAVSAGVLPVLNGDLDSSEVIINLIFYSRRVKLRRRRALVQFSPAVAFF